MIEFAVHHFRKGHCDTGVSSIVGARKYRSGRTKGLRPLHHREGIIQTRKSHSLGYLRLSGDLRFHDKDGFYSAPCFTPGFEFAFSEGPFSNGSFQN